MTGQICFCIFTSLSDLLSFICIPRTTLLDKINTNCQIQNISFFGDSFSKHDIELCFFKRRRNLILHDLDAGSVADHLSALLQRLDPADIHTDR